MTLKSLLRNFFKVQGPPILILFQNGDKKKTILKNLEQQFMSIIKLKPNFFKTKI